MNRDTFLDKQFAQSVTAGMNQRYHQHKAETYWRNDTIAKVLTAIFAIASLVFAAAAICVESLAVDVLAIVIAAVAAFGAVFLNVVPYGAWELHHRDLLRRWTDIREDADSLEFNLTDDGGPSEDAVHRLKELDARIHRTCGLESAPDKGLLDTSYRDEERSRHGSAACASRLPEPAAH